MIPAAAMQYSVWSTCKHVYALGATPSSILDSAEIMLRNLGFIFSTASSCWLLLCTFDRIRHYFGGKVHKGPDMAIIFDVS